MHVLMGKRCSACIFGICPFKGWMAGEASLFHFTRMGAPLCIKRI